MPGENIPQEYRVQVPGVINTYTKASSNQQALAFALQQAFQNRNSFMWEGKSYEGEVGLKSLIADILNFPGFFEYVQQLPGMASQPLEVALPLAAPAPQDQQSASPAAPQPPAVAPQKPMAMASKDEVADAIVRKAAAEGIDEGMIGAIVLEAGRVASLSQEDQDDLSQALHEVCESRGAMEQARRGPDMGTVASRYQWKRAMRKAASPHMADRSVSNSAFHNPTLGSWLRKSAEELRAPSAFDAPPCPKCGSATGAFFERRLDSMDIEVKCPECNHLYSMPHPQRHMGNPEDDSRILAAALIAGGRVVITEVDHGGPESNYWFELDGEPQGYITAPSIEDATAQLEAKYGGAKTADADADEPFEEPNFDTFGSWLDRFLSEKGVDLEQTFEFDLNGEFHVMPYGVVVEAMRKCPASEQKGIKAMIVKIDFANGDVLDYLRHLGKGLAANSAGGEMESEGSEKQDGAGKGLNRDKFEACTTCGFVYDPSVDYSADGKCPDCAPHDVNSDLAKVAKPCPSCGGATEQVDNVRDLGADNIIDRCPKCGWERGPEMDAAASADYYTGPCECSHGIEDHVSDQYAPCKLCKCRNYHEPKKAEADGERKCEKCGKETGGTKLCLDCSPEGTMFKKPDGASMHGPAYRPGDDERLWD